MPRSSSKSGSAVYGDLVRQYLELRDRHPGVLLLFRVGSFYEVLFEDAELVARELGLKLGERPSGGEAPPVPQAGFAHHALDSFLPRLLGRGYRVAVCEERDEPEAGAASGGGVRTRAVVRTLTPGTVSDPRLLREDRPTYLVAVASAPGGADGPADGDTGSHASGHAGGAVERLGLAWTDVAAGEFKAGEFDAEDAAAELQRLDPAEVLVPGGAALPDGLLARRTVTHVGALPDADAALRRAFPRAAMEDLADLPAARAAAGLVVRYLEETRGADTPPLDAPGAADAADGVRLDAATQRHLELVEAERTRERAGSLLAAVDRTATPMGRRMLRGWLLRPLTSLRKIAIRQDIVAELVASDPLREALAAQLAATSDLERLAGRVAARRGTLEDLRALAAVAAQVGSLEHAVSGARTPFLRSLGAPRPRLEAFATQAATVLADPTDETDGGALRPDASPALADAVAARERASAWQARYVRELRRLPSLARVRLEHTGTQGLFLEVPSNTMVPDDWVRRGGLQKVERYSTAALEEHAVALADAEAAVAAETEVLLVRLRADAAAVAPEARDLARHLAATDALVSLAAVAAERRWVRPAVEEGGTLSIAAGRHPVVEALGPQGTFTPNDALLEARGDRNQVVVLTGPNMAGKSTWMRQVATIALLAQAGSFVPAAHARVGVVDAIYTRIGAVDDLAAGRSTFMVEMEETAAVLRGATDRSLILLDEIGRGTSTHDGMAIAWAVIEHLATGPVRPRAIVATHYHELAALAGVHPQIALLQAAVEERPDGIVFPHRVEPGAAGRSFGIEVARLAGLPAEVLDRARRVADAIEPLSAEIATRLGAAHAQHSRGHGQADERGQGSSPL